MLEFVALAQACAPAVHVDTMSRIVQVESSFNPHAIGVVGAKLERQPRNRAEAIVTAQWLDANGYNYSVGLAQVNQANFAKYGLSIETAFEPCENLRAGAAIFTDCYRRARKTRDDQQALQAALSCYYSGNFTTGFKHGYVQKVLSAQPDVIPNSEPRARPAGLNGRASRTKQ